MDNMRQQREHTPIHIYEAAVERRIKSFKFLGMHPTGHKLVESNLLTRNLSMYCEIYVENTMDLKKVINGNHRIMSSR
jgi:hypothetical protein